MCKYIENFITKDIIKQVGDAFTKDDNMDFLGVKCYNDIIKKEAGKMKKVHDKIILVHSLVYLKNKIGSKNVL